jgi:D-xylonolactonase
MAIPHPEVLVDCTCDTGEGPLWKPDEQRIYWLDIPAGRLYRHHLPSGETETFEHDRPIGGMTLQDDGSLLLFMGEGRIARWDNGAMTVVIDSIPEEHGNRFNDVIADPEGRVFCGTMTTEQRPGRLYRLDPDKTLTVLLEGLGTPNGMGFTPDGSGLYFTDTRAHSIYLFDYDRRTGAITNQRVFAEATDGRGRPDGMTVDADGCIWSGRWDGFGLVRYSPDAEEMAWIPLPARNVSCITFGGPDYTDMFITTAIGKDPSVAGEHGGALFHLNLGITGVPEFRSRIASK